MMTGDDLYAWRQRHGWSQQRAANEMGYSRRQYIRLEQKGDKPLLGHIERVVHLIDEQRDGDNGGHQAQG